MFHLLATTKCKRQQIAILIISFFAYVAGIRNEGNNMLLQQQQQHQQTTIENSNYQSPVSDIKQQSSLNFRPSQIIDFTLADAAVPHAFKPTYMKAQHSTNTNLAIYNNKNNSNNNNNVAQKHEKQNVNRRYTIEKATATYGNAAEKQFSFPNEQQQIPQHLTDKPIYIYRDPFTNENYQHTPTETSVKDTPTTYQHNNYNSYNAYKQENTHHQFRHDDNQEYLVQSSMTVGTHQQQGSNPFRPYMSLSDDKDVYLKRPGIVYDEKPSYNHPNSVIKKKSEETQTLKVNKISYDSHDYPPPSYFQQQTSNFLPTPVPAQPSTPKPVIRTTPPPTTPPRQDYRPPLAAHSTKFGHGQRPQQQYLQSSQSTLPNYANNIDNYLLNKQQASGYYRQEVPPPLYLQQQQQHQQHYENRPPTFEYVSRPPSSSSSYEQQHQYFSRPPAFNSAQTSQYPQYETARPPAPPPPGRPSYNNYYDYQIGEIPPSTQTSSPSSQQFNYPYPRPPTQYPYQGPYRPPTLTQQQQQQQNGLATTLAQYAPQFTSLLLGSIGGGGDGSNTNGPLTSLIGALTGATNSQQQSSSSSSSSSFYNRRPVNSQLIKALENIARNDDLQCVPKVLCQMIAAQTQRGQLPTFITSPAITNFLAGFPAASPALIYGRALLLGLSGGEKSCHQTYVQCPKTEYEIIYYLNNHRGGFFKFFSEPEEQQQTVSHDATQQSPMSLFSILAALTGTPTTTTTTTPRPKPKPQAPSSDITSGIGNFFTNLLSDYMGGAPVEYQRSFKRLRKRSLDDKIMFEGENEEKYRDVIRFQDESGESHRDILKLKDEYYDDIEEDFHDEEDDEDTQEGVGFKDYDNDYLDDIESRVVHKTSGKGKRINFFPQMSKEALDEFDKEDKLKNIIKRFNDSNRKRKLKFPTNSDKRKYKNIRQGKVIDNGLTDNELNYGQQFNNYVENSYENFQKETKKIKFIDNNEKEEDNEREAQSLYSYYIKNMKNPNTKVVFPERGGRILNHPYYAASYMQHYLGQEHLEQEAETAQENDKYIIPYIQRPTRFPEFPATPSGNLHNTHINHLDLQSSFNSNTAVNNNIYVASAPANNHFLPTPPPPDNDYTSSNSIYSNNDYSSDQNSYTILKQSSSLAPPIQSNNFYKPPRYTFNSESNYNQNETTRRPYVFVSTTKKSDDKNIYVTNGRGVTEYFITPEGRKVYL